MIGRPEMRGWLAMGLAVGLAGLAGGPVAMAQAGQRAVLVELFTSEGCSSCPPADALLRQVNGSRTASGVLVVGLSEHVTYWNRLGWADPFSTEAATARQSAYGDRFHLDSVYTPQMVVNGSEQFVGGDRGSLDAALRREASREPMAVRIASAAVEDGSLRVVFATGAPTAKGPVEMVAVLADDLDSSSVERGENAGRTLSHVSVARLMAKVATVHGVTEEQAVQLALPKGFRMGQGGHHVILFAQAAGTGAVLGTDVRPL